MGRGREKIAPPAPGFHGSGNPSRLLVLSIISFVIVLSRCFKRRVHDNAANVQKAGGRQQKPDDGKSTHAREDTSSQKGRG